jgi:hypothetical protein
VSPLLHEMKGLKVVGPLWNTMCIWHVTSIYTSKIICLLLFPKLNYMFQFIAYFLPIIYFQKFNEFIMYNCWNRFLFNNIINNIILSTNSFIHHTQQSIISLQVWKINYQIHYIIKPKRTPKPTNFVTFMWIVHMQIHSFFSSCNLIILKSYTWTTCERTITLVERFCKFRYKLFHGGIWKLGQFLKFNINYTIKKSWWTKTNVLKPWGWCDYMGQDSFFLFKLTFNFLCFKTQTNRVDYVNF